MLIGPNHRGFVYSTMTPDDARFFTLASYPPPASQPRRINQSTVPTVIPNNRSVSNERSNGTMSQQTLRYKRRRLQRTSGYAADCEDNDVEGVMIRDETFSNEEKEEEEEDNHTDRHRHRGTMIFDHAVQKFQRMKKKRDSRRKKLRSKCSNDCDQQYYPSITLQQQQHQHHQEQQKGQKQQQQMSHQASYEDYMDIIQRCGLYYKHIFNSNSDNQSYLTENQRNYHLNSSMLQNSLTYNDDRKNNKMILADCIGNHRDHPIRLIPGIARGSSSLLSVQRVRIYSHTQSSTVLKDDSSRNDKHHRSICSDGSVTLEEAMTLSDSARLIFQTLRPYSIVHINAGALSLFHNIACMSGTQQLISLTNHPISKLFSNFESYIHFDNILQDFEKRTSGGMCKYRSGSTFISEREAYNEFIVSRGHANDGFPCDFEVKRITSPVVSSVCSSSSYYFLEIIGSSKSLVTAPICVAESESKSNEDGSVSSSEKYNFPPARSVG